MAVNGREETEHKPLYLTELEVTPWSLATGVICVLLPAQVLLPYKNSHIYGTYE